VTPGAVTAGSVTITAAQAVDTTETTPYAPLFDNDDAVTVTASVNSGYNFVNWMENNVQVSTDAVYTFTMGTSDTTLAANFSRTHSGGGNKKSTTSPRPVNSATGSAMLNPAAGGTVSLGSDMTLKIPANALKGSDSLPVAIARADSPPPAPSGFMIMGAAYQLTVNGQDHYSFRWRGLYSSI